MQKYGIPLIYAKNGRSRRAARDTPGGRCLFLAAEDAAERTAEDAAQTTHAGLLLLGRTTAEHAAEDAAQDAAAAALEGEEDVVEVHVAVTVLVLDDVLQAAHDLGDEGEERGAGGAELELGEDVGVEDVAGERRDRALGRIGLAGQEGLDLVETARGRRRLGEGAEDGIGKTAEDLLLEVLGNLDVAVGNILGHLLEDDVTEIHNVLELVFCVFVPTNIMKINYNVPAPSKKDS